MTNVVRPRRSAQAVLDQRLALAVEARRGLVEDQDARVGENRARDRDALALPARQLDAALADDRVVALLELLDELVAVRDPADAPRSPRASPPAARTRCSRRSCRRTGSCPAARRRAASGSRAAARVARSRPSTSTRPVVGRLNAITRLMSVLLPEPLEPTSAVVVPAGARNETCFSTGTPGLYSKLTSSNATSPRVASSGAARVLVDPRSPSPGSRGCGRGRRTPR